MTENVNPADQNELHSEAAQENTTVEPTSTESRPEPQADAPADAASAESPSPEASSDVVDSQAAPQAEPASAEPSASEAEPSVPAETVPSPEASESASTEAPSTGATVEGGASTGTTQTPESPVVAGADAAASGETGTAEGAIESSEPTPEPGMPLEEMRLIWDELEIKKNNREPVEATITGANRGGVVTEYKGVEVFVPLSHWSIDRGAETSDVQIGEPVTLYILEMTHFDTDARRITGSRRTILRKELIDSLEVGQRLVGRVSSITEFGAFIDIGGVDGLLHVSEMSYARNKQPNALVRKGDELEVIIKNIEKGGKRISLGHKELFNSPWVGAAEKYPPDSVQKGKVVSLTDLGAFVELEPGVDGLIRPRELSWIQRIGAASDVLNVGQDVDVMVLNVNEEQERMSLSLKRAADNPWPQIVERFGGDTLWDAEVRELSNKGAVVSVEGVEGFLPRGRMGRDARKLTELKPGDKLQVRVVEIDPKRPSVIFGIPMEAGSGGGGGGRPGPGGGGGEGGRRSGGRDRDRDRDRPAPPMPPAKNELKTAATAGTFSLGDMLGDALKEKLGIEPEPEPTPAPTAASEESAPADHEVKSAEIGNANDPLATSAEERTVVTGGEEANPVNPSEAEPTQPVNGEATDTGSKEEGAQGEEVPSEEKGGEA